MQSLISSSITWYNFYLAICTRSGWVGRSPKPGNVLKRKWRKRVMRRCRTAALRNTAGNAQRRCRKTEKQTLCAVRIKYENLIKLGCNQWLTWYDISNSPSLLLLLLVVIILHRYNFYLSIWKLSGCLLLGRSRKSKVTEHRRIIRHVGRVQYIEI